MALSRFWFLGIKREQFLSEDNWNLRHEEGMCQTKKS